MAGLYDGLTERSKGRDRRKLENNTYLERRPGGAWAVRLHATDILTVQPNGTVQANTGGWESVTTKARLNEYLPGGWGIGQTKGVWYWYYSSERIAPFTSGDKLILTPSGYALDAQDAPKPRAL